MEESSAVLSQWETAEADNPEMYIAHFNYYLSTGRKEIMQMTTTPPEQGVEYLTISDSTGATEGYMYSTMGYDDSIFNLAIHYINKGIEVAPERLDMRFGKTYALNQGGRKDAFLKEVEQLFHANKEYGASWKWSGNEPLEQDDEFFESSMQDYFSELIVDPYYALDSLVRVLETAIEYFPKSIEFINDLGVVYYYNGEYSKAVEYFQLGVDINPSDEISSGNLAYIYMELGENEKALAIYRELAKSTDPNTAQVAEQYISEIEAKN